MPSRDGQAFLHASRGQAQELGRPISPRPRRSHDKVMDIERFEQLVGEALAELPRDFADRLENVSIVIEDFATPEQLAKVDLNDPHRLLGLYEGVPLTRRSQGYAGALPDRISIFRIPIEELCRTDDQIRKQVRETVMHELGHYFGMNEQMLGDT